MGGVVSHRGKGEWAGEGGTYTSLDACAAQDLVEISSAPGPFLDDFEHAAVDFTAFVAEGWVVEDDLLLVLALINIA